GPHRRPRPVGGDAARERAGGGRGDHPVDRAARRQPRRVEDGLFGGERARRRDEEASQRMIRRLDARTAGVAPVVRALVRDPDTVAPEVSRQVEEILAAVRARGDAAVLEYAARLEGDRGDAAGLRLTDADWRAARQVSEEARAALAHAAAASGGYHSEAAP